MKISGNFDVNMQSLEHSHKSKNGTQLGRMALDKTYHGDLSATSKGEMLTAMTNTKGSAGYVAIEQVTGTLHGKSGSFVLQHFGIMGGGQERLILEVVPDSGTGELAGITGKMNIDRKEGKHFYDLEYELDS